MSFPSNRSESYRSQILDFYLETIRESFQENSSRLKLINYGTGSGKTHQLFQAICETIKANPSTQIIGIYVAPLREHLQVPESVRAAYKNVPIYTINSIEMKMADQNVKLYKQWIDSIIEDKNIWVARTSYTQDKVNETKQRLIQVKSVINRLEYIKNTGFGSQDFNDSEIKKATQELNNLIESFLDFLIKCHPDETIWSKESLELVKIFYPLHLLREKSGILMLTYDKFETSIPYFTHNGKDWIKKSSYLDQFVQQSSNESRKFIIAFDEQESGYEIILDKKIDIISPERLAINNVLSSINREFSMLFSNLGDENRKFLDFLDGNKGAFDIFREHLEQGKTLDSKFQNQADLYQRLTYGEGNSINFIQHVIKLYKGLSQAIVDIDDITKLFNSSDNQQSTESDFKLDFQIISRVLSKFENNRSLLIPQSLYSEISNDLMNIFAYNNLYVYNIEVLQRLFLAQKAGGHVYITEEETSDKTSLAELIYVILAIRTQVGHIRTTLANVLKADDSQSRSLNIWSEQINKAKTKLSENESDSNSKASQYLNRNYVYESYKSIINIKEISRYQSPENNLIDHQLREVSIGSTAIFTSPEHKIVSMLRNNSNVIFLISATGGINGDLTTSYDMCYLEDTLSGDSQHSTFQKMTSKEVNLCEEIRNYRSNNRRILVNFFDKDLLSFPNQDTQKFIRQIEKNTLNQIISNFKSDKGWFSKYKQQEITGFVRFLLYLFEDEEIQEIIAFTQTLRWIKETICQYQIKRDGNFIFEPSPEHPNIYRAKINHPKYRSDVSIKLIFYESKFNDSYSGGAQGKTYLDELQEKEGEKIFFISAYQSASKGLNPIIRDRNGVEKDFDCLVLLMDRYYTVMNPKSREASKSTIQYHFALMKSIVNIGDSRIEIKDFNEYVNKPEATTFRRNQHQILLGKDILQTIGRSERRDIDNQVIKIFINEETRKNLVSFYRYLKEQEESEIRKLSVNNYSVYLKVQEEEQRRAIADYEDHVYDEINACRVFHEFRNEMLDRIEEFHQDKHHIEITKIWDMLRNLVVFKAPDQYLNKLRQSGLFDPEFIESLFYCNGKQTDFVPYLAEEEENGKKYIVISDGIHGRNVYAYLEQLYPDRLKMAIEDDELKDHDIQVVNFSTSSIYQIYNQLIPDFEVFNTYIPRPSFFYDVLKPSLAENFVDCWITKVIFKNDNWKKIKDGYGFEKLLDFKKYNKLYELFDLYYTKENTLFCIDVKSWSEPSGDRLSSEALKKAKTKLEKIAESYQEFTTVKGLLLNLHAPQEKTEKYSPSLSSGNLIYFDDYNCPIESNILRDFLFCKEK
jgi:hypothetical protein